MEKSAILYPNLHVYKGNLTILQLKYITEKHGRFLPSLLKMPLGGVSQSKYPAIEHLKCDKVLQKVVDKLSSS